MKDPYDLPHHPAAALFPMLAEAELREMAADIKANGQHEPIILCHGKVLDGRNRLAACKLAGVKPCTAERGVEGSKMVSGYSGGHANPTDYVVSLNLHRRHLTAEQKREVIAAVLKANPKRSNRQVAEQVKADHKTVGTVRQELEGRGEIPHVESRTDTKGRQQPATKAAPIRIIEPVRAEPPPVTVKVSSVPVDPLPPPPPVRPAPWPPNGGPKLAAVPAEEEEGSPSRLQPTQSPQEELEMIAVRFRTAIFDVEDKWAKHPLSHALANEIREFITHAAARHRAKGRKGKGGKPSDN